MVKNEDSEGKAANTTRKQWKWKKRTSDELTCKICSKTFDVLYNLTRHMVKHTGERNHPCSLCSANFLHRASLLRHIRTHTGEKPFQCLTCGNRFSQSSSLKKHEKTHLPKVKKERKERDNSLELKTFVCEYCGKCFKSSLSRKRHTMVSHEDKADLSCESCGKGFLFCQQRSFEKHSRICELRPKSKTCADCGKSFGKMSAFKRHLKHHTKAKDYFCSCCGKAYADKRNLVIHTQKVHPEISDTI